MVAEGYIKGILSVATRYSGVPANHAPLRAKHTRLFSRDAFSRCMHSSRS